MTFSILNVSRTMNTILDSTAYHVFDYRGSKLLFDVGTTAVCEINEFTYRLLTLAGIYDWDETMVRLQKEFPNATLARLSECFDMFKRNGLFLAGSDTVQTSSEVLNSLWRHTPRRLQLFVAQQCNLRCKYCYGENNSSNVKKKLMTVEVAKQAVDYLVSKSGKRRELQITFFGGEPTLNFKIIKEVVAYCRELEIQTNKHFLFELITNGTLLNRYRCDYLLDNKFLLFVSIDGCREMNNAQRPSVNGIDYYDVITKSALYLINESRRRKSKYAVKIRANLTAQQPNIFPVVECLEAFGSKLIGIGSIAPLSWAPDETPMSMTEAQLNKLSDDMETMVIDVLNKKKEGKNAGVYANRLFTKIVRDNLKIRSTLGVTCGIGRNTNAVDCDGNIYPCHRYVGLDAYIIGNIYSGLDKQKTMGLYRSYFQNAKTQCSECWARKLCAGGCPWEISSPDGRICKRNRSDCERRLKGIERSLWLRKEIKKCMPCYFLGSEQT